MKRLRLYLDTTVWNYHFADDTPEKKAHTLDFFQRVRWGSFDIFASEIVTEEFAGAPPARASKLKALWAELEPSLLPVTTEVRELAATYLTLKALPTRSKADALHVALTTVHQMDALVSWNFKHLANLSRRQKLAAVNRRKGYTHPLELVTPLEVLNDEKR